MIAVYRIIVQGWTKEEAIQEFAEGGFGFHREIIMLPYWLNILDVEGIRRKAGIKAPPHKIGPPRNINY